MIKILSRFLEFYKLYKFADVPLIHFFRKSRSLASLKILHGVKRINEDFAVIIDVGANQGQFSIASNFFFPKARIFAFEPSRKAFEQLLDNTKDKRNIEVFQLGLGEKVGKVSFFENEYSLASSPLEMSNYQKSKIPETSNAFITEIDMDTLDNFSKKHVNSLNGKLLLKLDVQGYEKNVLDGAKSFLNKVDYLLFETSFVELYKEELLFAEMHCFLTSKGFDLVQPLAIFESFDLEILQMDVIYKNSNRVLNKHGEIL